MNVLICLSHNYVMPSGIMLESLFTNNESEVVQIYAIVDEDVTEEDKRTLNDIVQKHHSNRVIFSVFTDSVFNVFPKIEHARVNRTTYFRLFAATLLPNEVDKILYLDGDIIIMDSLRSLWKLDIDGVAVAGVMDNDQSFTQFNRLHYPSKLGYINNGVLMINLKYWRDHQIERRFVSFIYEHSDWIKWHDQDVLNYVLREEKQLLPLKYNVQHTFYFKPEYSLIDYWSVYTELHDALRSPIILHYTSMLKPWYAGCPHPKAQVFLDYKKKTIWADTPLLKAKRTLKERVFHGSRLFLVLLHVLPQRVGVDNFFLLND